jgi:hypothetical protein
LRTFGDGNGGPAVEAGGIAKPARIYDLRSTFISNALARGLTVFEGARIAGTSTSMIELHYGSLLDSARESLLDPHEAPDYKAVEAAEGGME